MGRATSDLHVLTIRKAAILGSGLLEGEVVIIDDNFKAGRVHDPGFAERAGLAHEHAAALAQGTITGLDEAGLALAFGAVPVLQARQHLGVGLSLVGKEPAMPTVMPRQRLPKAAQGRFAPAAQRPAHDAPPGPFDDQSKPHLALFVPHEAPQRIAFQHSPPLALGVGRAAGRGGRVGEGAAAFFIRLAIVTRATPVSRAMLRGELRSLNSAATWAYCAALRPAAGTNRPS